MWRVLSHRLLATPGGQLGQRGLHIYRIKHQPHVCRLVQALP